MQVRIDGTQMRVGAMQMRNDGTQMGVEATQTGVGGTQTPVDGMQMAVAWRQLSNQTSNCGEDADERANAVAGSQSRDAEAGRAGGSHQAAKPA